MKTLGPMILISSLSVVSCADRKDDSEGTQKDEALSPLGESAASSTQEIDASNRTEWVGLDLDRSAFIPVKDFPNDSSWDLAFKRTSIRMHGESVQMKIVDQDYHALTWAPKEGYAMDQPTSDPSAPETTGLAFHVEPSWYSYDVATHAVSSRGLTYVIKSNEGRFFKLKIHDYYNAARLPAYLNLEYQELKGVEP